MYGSSLQRPELLPHFSLDLAKDVLKLHFRTSQVKRYTEESRLALRLLDTLKTTDNSVARLPQDTRRRLDFEFREPNPKLKSGCNICQILWLTIVWPRELPQGNFCKHGHIFMSCWVISDRSRKEKPKDWGYLVYLERPDFSLRTWNYKPPSKFYDTQATGKANNRTVLFFFTAVRLNKLKWHLVSDRITRPNSALIFLNSFWTKFQLLKEFGVDMVKLNPLRSVGALITLIDFTLSNARRFYSSMGNPSDMRGLKGL